MSMYTDIVRQWATDTRRAGFLKEADGTGEVGLESASPGSRLAVRFTLKVEMGRIADARYEVFGCGFSMAACAVAADMAVGYPLDDVRKINSRRVDEALDGLPSDRSYCADLAVDALQAAVSSAQGDRHTVSASVDHDSEHGARVSIDDPVYSVLMGTPQPIHVSAEDRHLFACLISVAAQQSHDPARMLGLETSDLDALLTLCFPQVALDSILHLATEEEGSAPAESNQDILSIILKHVPLDAGFNQLMVSVWLAQILAARSMLPGHLWVAMGLTERPQLTAAIRRHLPTLAEANGQNMRWKRYFYKQVCDLNGGTMCKAPNCGVCSDYHLCFDSQD